MENFKIPGLDWEGLSITLTKFIQNYVAQELARYKSKNKYLARLQHLKLLPVITEERFNKHDPCDRVEMLKIEWNGVEMSQPNGHYLLTIYQNYTQNLRVVLKCIQMIPIELHVEVIGQDSSLIETGTDNRKTMFQNKKYKNYPEIVKWPLLITTELTWGKVLYGMLTLIRNAKPDLPIENTNAVFIFQPNKLSIIQATVNIKKFRKFFGRKKILAYIPIKNIFRKLQRV